MDLTQLANLGEFIGGVAVLATLIYLAIQVRTGAKEQRMASMREATREMATVAQAIGDSSEKADLWMQGVTAFEEMDATERLRFSVISMHGFRTFEQVFYQAMDGAIEPEIWLGFETQIRSVVAYPGVQAWWLTRRDWYGERFRAFIESHIRADNEPRLYGEAAARS